MRYPIHVVVARRVGLAALVILAAARGAHAQSAIYGAGLQAWLGCWAPDLAALRDDAAPAIVCIAPTADVNVADVLTVLDGRVVSRETLDATGRSRPIAAERCSGTRSASWSRDGRRLFSRSAGTCAGVPSSTSGVLAITADGDWLDVEGISAGDGTSVRVARYREVEPPAALPASVRSALRAQSLATRSVRVAAAAPVRADDVLEAWRAADSVVVEAWLLERAQRVDVSDDDVASLLRAGVSPRIADALGATADPDGYTLARRETDRFGSATTTSVYDATYGLPLGWGWSYLPPRGSRYGYGYRDAWRRGYYRPPVIIVRGRESRPHGRERPHGDDRGAWGRDDRHTGAQRPRTPDSPPAGDPRHAPPQQSGGTVRLGKPRG